MAKISGIQNPLYLHPSDSINSVQFYKLVGPSNYREWNRATEITLAAKRKLGFAEQWDTCNNMVIAWIIMNVYDSIKKSVMFLNTGNAIWKELETRFSRTDGNRKFQNGRTINEYYSSMKTLWEEINGLSLLPPITKMDLRFKHLHQQYKNKSKNKDYFNS
ncbi:Bone marrow stromal antigen 2 [Bienertia sinuspersici]